MVTSLSAAQARRIALGAQGFGAAPPATVGARQLNLGIKRLSLLQIDSVNVFERSHYLPLFARLGAYDRTQLDTLVFARRSDYTEYWAHQAAIIPLEDWPLFRWRMEFYRARHSREGSWGGANGEMMAWLRAELAEKGPLPASKIEHESNVRRGPWWGWSDVKLGLETLWFQGDVATAGRTRFERSYGLTDHVLPARLLDLDIPREDAIRELVRRSVRALGIGTVSDIYDYYRMRNDDTKKALADLVEAGEVVPVTVNGWDRPAFMDAAARTPRRIETAALLSPFDPVVWERDRALRMFGFHYRIEIYTPAPKRVFGYYSLPLLIDEDVVGRIDLKSDRQNGVLRVQSAWREEGSDPDPLRVIPLLRRIADWQGLGDIVVADRGDLAPTLAAALS
jgi:uncharacterized protein YcaQ